MRCASLRLYITLVIRTFPQRLSTGAFGPQGPPLLACSGYAQNVGDFTKGSRKVIHRAHFARRADRSTPSGAGGMARIVGVTLGVTHRTPALHAARTLDVRVPLPAPIGHSQSIIETRESLENQQVMRKRSPQSIAEVRCMPPILGVTLGVTRGKARRMAKVTPAGVRRTRTAIFRELPRH